MPNKRERTTAKASWKIEHMEAALKAVASGTSIRKAAVEYNIPFSTIKDRVKVGRCYGPSLGTKCVFTKEQESELEQHALLLAKLYFGITVDELRKLAFEYAERNGIKNKFSKENRQAGKDWLYAFLKRHPSLSLRKPEATSVNRVLAFNKNEVMRFYTNLELVISKYKFPATKIYNVDETGISTVQKPSRIIAPKGMKQVGALTSWERGRNITVCCAFSAAGHYIPPMFIFPRKRMSPQLQRGGPPGSVYQCSKTGWMTAELFTIWLQHFTKETNVSTDNPILLVMDNHSSHISLPSYLLCKQKGIHIVSIPPHTSHRLQPLDLTFYGPLKIALNKECDIFMKTRKSEKITPYDMAELFNKAYSRVSSLEKATKGFERSGIWPLNPNTYTDEDFMAAVNLGSPNNGGITEGTLPSVSMEFEDEQMLTAVNQPLNFSQTPIASTSIPTLPKDPSIPASTPSLPSNQNPKPVSITEISPIPGPSKTTKRQRASTKQHSEIITATPFKLKLEELEERRAEKIRKELEAKNNQISKRKPKENCQPKIKSKAKQPEKNNASKMPKKSYARKMPKKILFDSTSEEDEIDESTLCDDRSDDLSSLSKQLEEEICCICGEFGRSNEMWFRCVMCANWTHKACSGVDTPDNYSCDFCASH